MYKDVIYHKRVIISCTFFEIKKHFLNYRSFIKIYLTGSANSIAHLQGPVLGPSSLPCTLSFYTYSVSDYPLIRVYVMSQDPMSLILDEQYIASIRTNIWEKKVILIGPWPLRFVVSNRYKLCYNCVCDALLYISINFAMLQVIKTYISAIIQCDRSKAIAING